MISITPCFMHISIYQLSALYYQIYNDCVVTMDLEMYMGIR